MSEEMDVYAAAMENRRYRDMAATEVLIGLGYKYELCCWVPPERPAFVPGDKGFTRGGEEYVVIETDAHDGLSPIRALVGDYDIMPFNDEGRYHGAQPHPNDLMPPRR